jgi:7-cyano-7-deazaguanine synthase
MEKLDSSSASRTAIVLVSGGLDSTACLHFLRATGFSVIGLFVDFGQPASRVERATVQTLARELSFDVTCLEFRGFGCVGAGELHGRNLLLIAAAIFYAEKSSCVVATGIHAGTGYYDCSEHFLAAVNHIVSSQSDGRVSLLAPFVTWSKRDVYDYAVVEKLPVSLTYSCENGCVPPCEGCASCRDRRALNC